jgi:hypothetical protein
MSETLPSFSPLIHRHSREGGNPSPAAEIYTAGDGPPPSRG